MFQDPLVNPKWNTEKCAENSWQFMDHLTHDCGIIIANAVFL